MKKFIPVLYTAALVAFSISCQQEVVDHSASPCPSDDPSIICPQAEAVACPPGASAGSADFTKFVAMGSSYTAGFQAGALFNEGQANSLPKILAAQFSCVGGGAFNQPDIGSENGYNIFVSPNPVVSGNTITTYGRFKLQGTPPKPTPVLAGNEAIPNPSLNPSFMFAGNKAALNNFAVQATLLAQTLSTATGNWANPNPAAGFSPFYARFASNPGSSTILGDAVSAAPTFFMFWAGMDDYLLYAAYGGDQTKAPLTPVGGGVGVGFAATYQYILGTILGSNPALKGVIANFPSVFALPHFRSVPYNPLPLAEAQASAANTGFAGYNQVIEALKGPPFNYPAADVNARKISFTAGNNPFVIVDETLNDYGDEFDGLQNAGAITAEQRAALVPYEQVRQTTAGDIIPLAAGSVLGTLADPANPASVRGIGVPLEDRYALIPSEIAAIEEARIAYNSAIADVAAANSTRVALADVNAAFTAFLTNKAAIGNNITLTPNINPPTGIYSEDGMHPNSRGYAFIANIFIDAINAKFGASVPKVNYANYGATALPINP
ncbi:MAG TPA: hypothetical protein VF490_15945 [Chryseosolibacter sp.]